MFRVMSTSCPCALADSAVLAGASRCAWAVLRIGVDEEWNDCSLPNPCTALLNHGVSRLDSSRRMLYTILRYSCQPEPQYGEKGGVSAWEVQLCQSRRTRHGFLCLALAWTISRPPWLCLFCPCAAAPAELASISHCGLYNRRLGEVALMETLAPFLRLSSP